MNTNIEKEITQNANTLSNGLSTNLNNLGDNINSKIDKVSDASKDLVNSGVKASQKAIDNSVDKINNVQDKTLKQYDRLTTGISNRVKEKPVQSILAVASVGAILALLLKRNNKKVANN